MNVLIITEANEIVASGHLMESIALARKCKEMGIDYTVLVNADMPAAWKERLIDLRFQEYTQSISKGMREIKGVISSQNFDVIIIDVRELKNEQIQIIRKVFNKRIVCLDEWGNRYLDCDIIVNNMLASYYWNYQDSKAKLYAGPQYLMLEDKLKVYHNKKKYIAKNIKKIVISMGGVDPKNHTKRIVHDLRGIPELFEIDVVLGGGYLYKEELVRTIGEDSRFVIHQNINYIYELFEQADVAFCAGGNTMYELAGIGTPMIVIPTMVHEEKNGKEFERAGACKLLEGEIQETLYGLNVYERKKMSFNGKKLIDGKGVDRILEIVVSK